MKKIIGLLVVVLLVVGAYMVFFRTEQGTSPVNTNNTATSTDSGETPVKADAKILERLRNVTVTASEDGGSVTLQGGEGEFTIDGSSKKGTVAIGGAAAETKVGSRKDIISYITVNPGNGQYLVLFEDKGSSLVQKSLVFLGNNITINQIVVAPLGNGGPEYAISVKGLEKGFDTTFIYSVLNGEIDAAKALKL